VFLSGGIASMFRRVAVAGARENEANPSASFQIVKKRRADILSLLDSDMERLHHMVKTEHGKPGKMSLAISAKPAEGSAHGRFSGGPWPAIAFSGDP
jgi:hypothetical protein